MKRIRNEKGRKKQQIQKRKQRDPKEHRILKNTGKDTQVKKSTQIKRTAGLIITGFNEGFRK